MKMNAIGPISETLPPPRYGCDRQILRPLYKRTYVEGFGLAEQRQIERIGQPCSGQRCEGQERRQDENPRPGPTSQTAERPEGEIPQLPFIGGATSVGSALLESLSEHDSRGKRFERMEGAVVKLAW